MALRPLLELIVAHAQDALFPTYKAMRTLRARWGKPGERDDWRTGDYFDLVRAGANPPACVDDKTWADLEFPELFASMNTTVTSVGSQVLYRQMREYVDDADVLAARHAVCAELRSNLALRESLQRKLLPLQEESNSGIIDFIFGKLPPPPRHQGLLWLWSLASFVVLLGVVVLAWPAWIWIAMLFVNLFVIFRACADAVRDVENADLCLRLEDPEVDGFFDYRLRVGPATERNAIRLLGEIGFPDVIVANAMATQGVMRGTKGKLSRMTCRKLQVDRCVPL